MIKVLHTIPDLHIGGVAKLLLKLIASFDNDEFEHHICYFGKNETLLENFQNLPIVIHKISYSGLNALPFICLKFNTLIKKNKIDIIHNHLFIDRIISGLCSAFNSAKIITTIHTTNNYSDASTFKNKLQIKLEDTLSKKTTKKFIAVSNTVKQVALEKKNIPLSRIKTIYSGVEIPARINRSIGMELKFVSIGRFVSSKGFIELLQVIKQLENKLNFKLYIIGDGPLRESIENEVKILGLESKVELVGYSNNVKEFLINADALISCSMEEGFGVSVVEAMSYSLPVFTFSLPIFEELSGKENVLITSKIGDYHSIAENIYKVCTSREEYEFYSRQVYERCKISFDIREASKTYLKLYKEIKNL